MFLNIKTILPSSVHQEFTSFFCLLKLTFGAMSSPLPQENLQQIRGQHLFLWAHSASGKKIRKKGHRQRETIKKTEFSMDYSVLIHK